MLLTSREKTFFAWRFILNGIIDFWLTISYQEPFYFTVSLLCFQIFTVKLILWPKMGSTHAISIVNSFFGFFFIRKHFLLFFMDFKLLMFHNNIVKISGIFNKQNLLKTCHMFTYPTNFCIFSSHFYYGKKWKYSIFLKPMNRIKRFMYI